MGIYLETFLLTFSFFFLVFILGQILKDNSIVDIAWGVGFLINAFFTFYKNQHSGLKGIVLLVLISIWSIRLTYYIAKRNIGKPEDYRYVEMRKKWGSDFVLLKSFLNVYLLQMLIQYVVSLPIIYGSQTVQSMSFVNYIGIVFWLVGFYFEAYGDYQLSQFKKKSENKGKLMQSGLWAWTRHPNYFGESLMCFGIFFVTITDIFGLWIILSPLLMTYLLVFVSGVKMLEKKYEGREDFELYKQRTSAFFPKPPERI